MARQAQSSQPTIRQALSGGGQLQSPIRAGGLYSYDEARAGYVGRASADISLGHLVASLSRLDNGLMRGFQDLLDRKIERDVAAGRVAFEENKAENKNRLDWKAASEADPTLQKLNPYGVRGYEEARQQSLAHAANIEAAAFAFTTLLNEKDPRVREEKINNFYAAQRAISGMEDYQDKLLLAQNYTAITAQGKIRLLAGLEERQSQQRIQDLALQHADLAVKELESLSHPALGGIDLDDPEQEEANSGTVIGVVSRQMKNASLNGVPDSKIPELTLNTYLTAYRKSGNTLYLEAAKRQEINGKKLINMPGVADKLEAIDRERLTRARADWQFARAQENERFKQAQRILPGIVYRMVENGEPLTEEAMTAKGIPDHLKATALKEAGELSAYKLKARYVTPLSRAEHADALHQARSGSMTTSEAKALYRDTGDESYLKAVLESEKEENKAFIEHGKALQNEMYSIYSGDMGGLAEALKDFNPGQRGARAKLGIDAAKMAWALYEVAVQDFKDKKQRSPTSTELYLMRVDAKEEANARMLKIVQANSSFPSDSQQPTITPQGTSKQGSSQPADPKALWALGVIIPEQSELLKNSSITQDQLEAIKLELPPNERARFDSLMHQQPENQAAGE